MYWDVLPAALGIGRKMEADTVQARRDGACQKSQASEAGRPIAGCRSLVSVHMSVCCASLPPLGDGCKWQRVLSLVNPLVVAMFYSDRLHT